MGNFLILMSGGTTPVINATLAGILHVIKKYKKKIYSGLPGLDGVLKNNLKNISNLSNSKINTLYTTPGSEFIGTSRVKKLTINEIIKFKSILKKKNITNVINIGGNGSLKQSIYLSSKLKNINFASCPKTVDNDLGDLSFKKMFFNPGFISCVEVWGFFLKMLNIENAGASSHDKIIISQTFGRETGFICGSIRYWDPKKKLPIMLLLPEDIKKFSKILSFAKSILSKRGRLMIFMSEGYNVGDIKAKYDSSGQIMYGSSQNSNCQLLCNKFNENGIQSRIFNPTILQRVFKFRNNTLNIKDNYLARKIGVAAVNGLIKKKKSFLVGIKKFNKIHLLNYENCKNFSRKMPVDFISKNKFDVTKKYLNYLNKIFNNK